jgi:hypothetical protein
MFRFRWFANFLGTSHARKDRPQPVRQHRGVRPTLEQLEDRMTPSQTLFNSGFGALLPAVQINPMMIEIQIFKQTPYLQFWNSTIQQQTGMSLPGVSEMFSFLEAQFPFGATFAHF